MKKIAWLLLFLAIIMAGFSIQNLISKPSNHVSAPKPKTKPIPAQAVKPAFNTAQYSHTDPTSIWVVVNKKNPLNPINYIPSDLVVPNVPLRVPGNETMQMRRVAADALTAMFQAAKADNISLMLASGYRSYSYQTSLYDGYVSTQGKAVADTQSARPGYSEHQTGLAADVEPLSRNCEVAQCFASTPEGIWLAANSYRFGFIIRYPQNGQAITGYEYEPWHIRYIGIPAATAMHNQGITTLEQFFGYPPAPTY